MPFHVKKNGKCYSLVNTKTGKVHSECTTFDKAKKQKRLLIAIEHGFKLPPKKSGTGLFDKREVGKYTPSARKLLEKVGDEPVKEIKIVRTPLQKALTGVLNFITLGEYEKAVKESNYDDMFHLALFINGKYQLDKQQVVVFKEQSPISDKSEVVSVKKIPDNLVVKDLMDKTKEFMGDEKFSNYDAKTNNCQDFVLAVLQANKLLTPKLKKFVKQDVQAVFNKLPPIAEKIAKFATDTGAVVNKIVEGESVDLALLDDARRTTKKNIDGNKMTETKTRKPNKWLLHVKKTMAMKKHKGKSFKQILQIAKQTYKK